MKIGIALDGVVRDFIGQLERTYDKYYPVELKEGEELPERKITSFNLLEYFPFSGGTQELNEFLYVDSALEVFGHAGESKINAVQHLNQLHNYLEDEGHEPIIISKELNNSKPSTLFFLSKLSGKFNTIKFVRDYDIKWDHVDVLITANPLTLESKPQGKTSIKVINDYNKNCDSDYTIIDIKELLDDKQTLNKILNSSTVSFTEIDE
jgi:hypothetical protein